MKTCFALIVAYIFLCVVGTASGAFLVMIYNGATHLVVGTQAMKFSSSVFLYGLSVSFPICVAVSFLFLVFAIIRHPAKKQVAGILTTIALGAFSWLVLLPLFFTFFKVVPTLNESEKAKLSPGFFRNVENSTYYFTAIDGNNNGEGLIITKNNSGKQLSLINNYPVVFLQNDDFADVLISETLSVPPLIKYCISGVKIFETAAFNAWNNGIFAWLSFASGALAMISVITWISISSWRFMNALFVIILFNGVIFFNLSYYGGSLTKIQSLISFVNGKFLQIPCFFIFAVNLIFVLIICLIALVAKITKRNPVILESDI